MTVDLGLPGMLPEPLAPRRKSRQVMVGKGKHAVPVGGGAPVSVQSMTTTVTADVNSTLQQIAEPRPRKPRRPHCSFAPLNTRYQGLLKTAAVSGALQRIGYGVRFEFRQIRQA